MGQGDCFAPNFKTATGGLYTMDDYLMNELLTLSAKIKQDEAKTADYQRVIEIQNMMLAERVATTKRLLAVTEKTSRQCEQLSEANNNLVWMAEHFTAEKIGSA